MGDPAFEIKCERTIGQDPFAIVFSGDVNMCTCDFPAFAGRIADHVSCMELFSNKGTAGRREMQVKDHPACALIAIAVQIQGQTIYR